MQALEGGHLGLSHDPQSAGKVFSPPSMAQDKCYMGSTESPLGKILGAEGHSLAQPGPRRGDLGLWLRLAWSRHLLCRRWEDENMAAGHTSPGCVWAP